MEFCSHGIHKTIFQRFGRRCVYLPRNKRRSKNDHCCSSYGLLGVRSCRAASTRGGPHDFRRSIPPSGGCASQTRSAEVSPGQKLIKPLERVGSTKSGGKTVTSAGGAAPPLVWSGDCAGTLARCFPTCQSHNQNVLQEVTEEGEKQTLSVPSVCSCKK